MSKHYVVDNLSIVAGGANTEKLTTAQLSKHWDCVRNSNVFEINEDRRIYLLVTSFIGRVYGSRL